MSVRFEVHLTSGTIATVKGASNFGEGLWNGTTAFIFTDKSGEAVAWFFTGAVCGVYKYEAAKAGLL